MKKVILVLSIFALLYLSSYNSKIKEPSTYQQSAVLVNVSFAAASAVTGCSIVLFDGAGNKKAEFFTQEFQFFMSPEDVLSPNGFWITHEYFPFPYNEIKSDKLKKIYGKTSSSTGENRNVFYVLK